MKGVGMKEKGFNAWVQNPIPFLRESEAETGYHM